jgi:hypothetical protein
VIIANEHYEGTAEQKYINIVLETVELILQLYEGFRKAGKLRPNTDVSIDITPKYGMKGPFGELAPIRNNICSYH